jgi:hypothetical protein
MLRSQEHSHIPARNVRPLELSREQVGEFATLAALGVGLDSYHLDLMVSAYNRMGGFGMDSITAPVVASSAAVPVQFLQTWLPGFVRTLTTARTIDELFGISTVGSFDDEEVVQGVLEYTGHAVPYTDHGNIPLASYGTGYEKRTVVRFEHGMGVGVLEQSRAARQGLDLASERRAGAMLALEIIRNKVGFYGYNSGGATYGALNEPNLPAYVNVAGCGRRYGMVDENVPRNHGGHSRHSVRTVGRVGRKHQGQADADYPRRRAGSRAIPERDERARHVVRDGMAQQDVLERSCRRGARVRQRQRRRVRHVRIRRNGRGRILGRPPYRRATRAVEVPDPRHRSGRETLR